MEKMKIRGQERQNVEVKKFNPYFHITIKTAPKYFSSQLPDEHPTEYLR